MKILAVGDSFTYGDELTNPLADSWPAKLSHLLGYQIDNLGLPSTGNTYTVRTVLENFNNYDLFIIAWSHFARIEVADQFGIYDTWPGNPGLKFSNNLDFRLELVKYYTLHYDDSYLYKQYEMNIVLLQNLLSNNNKKYLMLDAFGNNQSPLRNVKTLIHDMIDTTYYLGWPNETMMEWTYGTEQGPGGHFLEDGHKLVADKIYEHIRHLGWVS